MKATPSTDLCERICQHRPSKPGGQRCGRTQALHTSGCRPCASCHKSSSPAGPTLVLDTLFPWVDAQVLRSAFLRAVVRLVGLERGMSSKDRDVVRGALPVPVEREASGQGHPLLVLERDSVHVSLQLLLHLHRRVTVLRIDATADLAPASTPVASG